MLGEIKNKALEDHIPIIMDDTLEVIKEILIKEKPVRILEIGTATGYSSICFATILLKNCIDLPILIDTIELDEIRANEAIKNISGYEFRKNNKCTYWKCSRNIANIQQRI